MLLLCVSFYCLCSYVLRPSFSKSAVFCQLSFQHFSTVPVLLFSLGFVLNFCTRSSNSRVSSSIMKYSALLQVDLSMFVTGYMLQTLFLTCECVYVWIGKPWVDFMFGCKCKFLLCWTSRVKPNQARPARVW